MLFNAIARLVRGAGHSAAKAGPVGDRRRFRAACEALEARRLLSAAPTLAPTIAKSTLPLNLPLGVATKGAVTLDVANESGGQVKGKATLEILASTDGAVDSSSILLARFVRAVNVSTATPKVTSLPVKIGANTLPAGSYSLLAEAIDPLGNAGVSALGPALTVAPISIPLSLAFTRVTLPPTIILGTRTHAVIVMKVTNTGDIPTLKPQGLTNDLFAEVFLSNFAIGSGAEGIGTPLLLRKQIGAGKSVSVTLPIKSIPPLTAGVQTIVGNASVTGGTIYARYANPLTVVDPSVVLAPTFTKDTIPASVIAGAKVHAVAVLRLTNFGNVPNQDLDVSGLTNKPGRTAIDLFATPIGDPAGSGTEIGAVSKPLRILSEKTISLSIPVRHIPSLPAGEYDITAQVTDPNGNVTTAISEVVNVA